MDRRCSFLQCGKPEAEVRIASLFEIIDQATYVGARAHISQVRLLVTILERHGVSVRMVTTARVAYVAYEDEHQIVAEPFAGERY